jgi:prophage regulatory protein
MSIFDKVNCNEALNDSLHAGHVPLFDVDCARLLKVTPSATIRHKAGAEEPQLPQPAIRILRLPEVMGRIGICRASIYQLMTEGTFPKSVSLGARAVGWCEHEIDAWLQARVSERPMPRHTEEI